MSPEPDRVTCHPHSEMQLDPCRSDPTPCSSSLGGSLMANQQKGSKGIKACSVAQWFDRFDYVPASLEGAENLQAKKNMQTHLMRHVKAPRTHKSVGFGPSQQFHMTVENQQKSII